MLIKESSEQEHKHNSDKPHNHSRKIRKINKDPSQLRPIEKTAIELTSEFNIKEMIFS